MTIIRNVALSFLLALGIGSAADITINDLLDTSPPSVTLHNGLDTHNLNIISNTGEFLNFTYDFGDDPPTNTFWARMFESDGTTLSDVLRVDTQTNSSIAEFWFYSDPATFPTVTHFDYSVTEDGTAQTLATLTVGHGHNAVDFTVAVASDKGDIGVQGTAPEPVGMLLMGAGLLGIGFLTKFRRV